MSISMSEIMQKTSVASCKKKLSSDKGHLAHYLPLNFIINLAVDEKNLIRPRYSMGDYRVTYGIKLRKLS